jgi:hypothetical protein
MCYNIKALIIFANKTKRRNNVSPKYILTQKIEEAIEKVIENGSCRMIEINEKEVIQGEWEPKDTDPKKEVVTLYIAGRNGLILGRMQIDETAVDSSE